MSLVWWFYESFKFGTLGLKSNPFRFHFELDMERGCGDVQCLDQRRVCEARQSQDWYNGNIVAKNCSR